MVLNACSRICLPKAQSKKNIILQIPFSVISAQRKKGIKYAEELECTLIDNMLSAGLYASMTSIRSIDTDLDCIMVDFQNSFEDVIENLINAKVYSSKKITGRRYQGREPSVTCRSPVYRYQQMYSVVFTHLCPEIISISQGIL